ncbi:hypothetical protein RclHR1_02640007 [Rhizophagus clarus]|uniref:Uncharacterized protein n=1 Tax=Rhizophagus clarus TaxID=94130 RepID=A0A2Z6R0F3_9GLOM|nr:hypothetical protein RclHR1_02640007 [Rhizophagus clarus]GES84633.1 hypothetical protein RCL_jg11421.t1 [Rhizophagus clarus]
MFLESLFSILGPLGWGIAWLLFRCEAIWTERDEFSNWIAAIFVAGMAEGLWAGCSLEDGRVNCDPGSLIVGRLCSDERDTFIARYAIKRTCKRFCCKDCRKIAIKASKWNAKDKNLQLSHIIDIIVKASLIEAALCRRNYRKAGSLAREIIGSLPTCSNGYSLSWMNCVELPCSIGFATVALVIARSITSNIDGKTGNIVIDKGILLKHSDADMYYGAEAIARFIDDPSVHNPSQQLYHMISGTPFPELNTSKQILLKHQIQSGACGWALLPLSKPEKIQYDRRPRICQKAIGKKYFVHIALLQIVIGIVLTIVKKEIFPFLSFFVGAGVTIFWSAQSVMNSYVLHGLTVPIRMTILAVIGSFILLVLGQVGPNGATKINGIIQTSLPVVGIIFWWIAYFIKHNKRFNYVALGLGIFIFVLKFSFMIYGVITAIYPIYGNLYIN